MLPSTAGQATFVVSPLGCPTTEPANCTQTRGGTFNSSKSESWRSVGNYTLGLEQNLGYKETAAYGFDTLALGFSGDIGSSALQSQVIASIGTDDYYVGIFGLGHQPYNFTNFSDPHPSFLTTMRSKNLIPSLSWAYTAGARYREYNPLFYHDLILPHAKLEDCLRPLQPSSSRSGIMVDTKALLPTTTMRKRESWCPRLLVSNDYQPMLA